MQVPHDGRTPSPVVRRARHDPYATARQEQTRTTSSSGSPARRPRRLSAAFVSASLRPFLIAALLESDEFAGRPALVVAGDDRGARDLALDLRAFLAPAPVRFYPARGVRYESHLAPPPHLVGLRIAALDSLLEPTDGDPPVVVASAVALMERDPRPGAAPARVHAARSARSSTSTRRSSGWSRCGYEREEQVFERGQFAVRGGILDVYPATEERAVRVELFGDEVESLRWFSTFTQRSLERRRARSRSRPPPSSAPSTASWPRWRRARTRRAPRRRRGPARGPASARSSSWSRTRRRWWSRPRRSCGPALADHWQDVTTSLHSDDAHDLYLPPGRGRARRSSAAPR